MHKLVTELEAAKYLSLSRSWLAQQRCYRRPGAPPYVRIGRTIRYDIEALNAWLDQRREASQ